MGEWNIRKVREFDNPLLYRKEYLFAIMHDSQPTPSRAEFREEIAKLLGVDKNLVVIKNLKTEFGTNTTYAEVYVYSNKEKMLEIEPKYILKRNGIME